MKYFSVLLLLLIMLEGCYNNKIIVNNNKQNDSICSFLPERIFNYYWSLDTSNLIILEDLVFSAGFSDSLDGVYYKDSMTDFKATQQHSWNTVGYLIDYPKHYFFDIDSTGMFSQFRMIDLEKCIIKSIKYYYDYYEVFYCDYSVKDNCYSRLYAFGGIKSEDRYIPLHFTKYSIEEISMAAFDLYDLNVIPVKYIEYRKSLTTGKDTIIEEDIPIERFLIKK